jgi:dihydrofolate synthase/folylpolyglutamate synthase
VRTHPVLSRLAGKGIRLGLASTRNFLAALGEPHLAAPVVHVAGTNGKGSVCTMVTSALVRAGYRVGTYTSPHLEHVNERFRIDGVPVDDVSLSEAIEALDRKRVDWGRQQGMPEAPLTYFEFVTVLAFQLFADRGVDVMVIEVGLGGRLDATNVVSPVVTAVTSIGLDHQDRLGDTLGAIAAEKAGIFKRGVPVVLGPTKPEARGVLVGRATQLGCPLWQPGTHLQRERRRDGWMVRTPSGVVGPMQLAMRGTHQGANASVAVGILHFLRAVGFVMDDEAIREGVATAVIAGRVEEVAPGLVVDGAHNIDGAEALARWLAERPRPELRILLFGIGAERDPMALLTPLLPHVDEVVLTRCAHPKARSPREIADALPEELDVTLSDGGDIEECLAEVYAEADETLVAGSLYLVGAVRSLVAEGALTATDEG